MNPCHGARVPDEVLHATQANRCFHLPVRCGTRLTQTSQAQAIKLAIPPLAGKASCLRFSARAKLTRCEEGDASSGVRVRKFTALRPLGESLRTDPPRNSNADAGALNTRQAFRGQCASRAEQRCKQLSTVSDQHRLADGQHGQSNSGPDDVSGRDGKHFVWVRHSLHEQRALKLGGQTDGALQRPNNFHTRCRRH